MSLVALPASAQDALHSRPISIINAHAVAGQTAIAVRLTAGRLSTAIGQRLVVETRVGGATSIASTAVAQARPDG